MEQVNHIDIAVWVDDEDKVHVSINGDEINAEYQQSDHYEFVKHVIKDVSNAVEDAIENSIYDGSDDDFCKSCML